jgi:acetyl CoA:N6-hydroxylysine acetyl transferase
MTADEITLDQVRIAEIETLPTDRKKLLRLIEREFGADESLQRVCLPMTALQAAGHNVRSLGCAASDGDRAVIERSGFYQTPEIWMKHAPAQRLSVSLEPGPDGRDHPRRAPDPVGEVYARYDPEAEVVVSFRAIDLGRDLDRFWRWQNDPRVAYFWEEDKPKEELARFLEGRQADPHTFPVIGCFDGEPAGYFEIYWGREDRLGAYYDAGPWDRGWHGLIGERAHLGRRKTGAWLRALTHYLFLDCPMTELVVGEPRVDNAKLLRYADSLAYHKIKEFDFPHKRSALMHCWRDEFFAKVRL